MDIRPIRALVNYFKVREELQKQYEAQIGWEKKVIKAKAMEILKLKR